MCWFGVLSKIYVAVLEFLDLKYTKINGKNVKKLQILVNCKKIFNTWLPIFILLIDSMDNCLSLDTKHDM